MIHNISSDLILVNLVNDAQFAFNSLAKIYPPKSSNIHLVVHAVGSNMQAISSSLP